MLQCPRLCTELQRGAAAALIGHAKVQDYLHTTPPHQGELMQVNWPWFLGIVSFSTAHHPKIRIPLCLYFIIVCNSSKKKGFPLFAGKSEGEGEME